MLQKCKVSSLLPDDMHYAVFGSIWKKIEIEVLVEPYLIVHKFK